MGIMNAFIQRRKYMNLRRRHVNHRQRGNKRKCDCLLFLIFCLGFFVSMLIAILIFVLIQHQTLQSKEQSNNETNKEEKFGIKQIDYSREFNPSLTDTNEFLNTLLPLKSTEIESNNLYKSLRDEIDVMKLPNNCLFVDQLYECHGSYFDNFTFFNDDWSHMGDAKWFIPSSISKTFNDGKKREFKKWRYDIINYPIIPKFICSKKERDDIRISIVTQTSMDRLDLIHLIAQNWSGVICVAIYIRLEESLLHSMQLIVELFEEIEAQTNALLDVSLLFETDYLYKQRFDNGLHSVMYPVNHLRNLALQTATTELVLLTDGDFMPSKDFHSIASKQYDLASQQFIKTNSSTNIVLIIPAFEFGSSYFGYSKKQKIAKQKAIKKEEKNQEKITNLNQLPLSKERVCELYRNDKVRGFHIHRCTACHTPTNYSKWMKASSPYIIRYKASYEPYIMTKRIGSHRYDARFRGYGWNKIVHLLTLAWLDQSAWIVANDLFIFHIPHNSSSDATNYFKGTHSERWKWIMGLSKLALRDLKKKIDQTGFILS